MQTCSGKYTNFSFSYLPVCLFDAFVYFVVRHKMWTPFAIHVLKETNMTIYEIVNNDVFLERKAQQWRECDGDVAMVEARLISTAIFCAKWSQICYATA